MNQCTFIGNLTRDPEIRTFANGGKVASFGIALNRKFKNKQTGQTEQKVTFIDLKAWGKQAEIIEQYFQKGDPIVIASASVEMDEWEDKSSGQKRTKLFFNVNQFEFPPSGKRRGDDTSRRQEEPETAGVAATDDDNIPF